MSGPPPRRVRRTAMVVVLAVAALGLGGCTSTPKPDLTATTFLADWAKGDLAAAAKRSDDPTAAGKALAAVRRQLGSGSPILTPGTVSTKDKSATARFTASWSLPGIATPWTYDGSLAMTLVKDGWQVHWQPADIHPKLPDGATLKVTRTLPDRAPVLDRTGQPLVTRTPVVTVGIEPAKVTSLPTLTATLATVLHVSAADITAAVKKAKPTDFVPVITLRRAAYDKVKPAIYNLAGTVFRTGTQSLGPTASFAQPLLGTVGPATAEALKSAGPGYRSGDSLGLSGLQEALNTQLAGTASARITAVVSAGGATDTTLLGSVTGKPGTPVKLTLDRLVQQVADATLAQVSAPAAIVALRPSTGEILAVANSPASPFDIALAGRYPPGSTFKIVTATSALINGIVKPDSMVSCPGTVTLGGRVVPNEDKFDLGRVSLTTAFAKSCNTVFAPLSVKLPAGALAKTAAQYGVGAGWQLPVTSFSGSIPASSSSVAEQAAEGYGQGQTLVSPLAEALMAATIAHGSVPAPSLVEGQPAKADTSPTPIPAAALAALRTYTRAVVTGGTATNLRSVPGGPVAGKTGTAEFGGTPPKAHSWFAGYQGDLAFSVFVYGGQTSGQFANPLAKTFLDGVG